MSRVEIKGRRYTVWERGKGGPQDEGMGDLK